MYPGLHSHVPNDTLHEELTSHSGEQSVYREHVPNTLVTLFSMVLPHVSCVSVRLLSSVPASWAGDSHSPAVSGDSSESRNSKNQRSPQSQSIGLFSSDLYKVEPLLALYQE